MKKGSQDNTTCLILAAGNSSRLGFPKQSVLFKGIPLLLHAYNTAKKAGCHPIFVVSGANLSGDQDILKDSDVNIIYNEDWEKGIGNSIRFGLKKILSAFPECSAVILMVCDQPYLTSEHIIDLIQIANDPGIEVVGSNYGETFGTPVLFKANFFAKLLTIDDHKGAKKLLDQSSPVMRFISLPNGDIDIDTVDDIEKIKS